MSLLQSQMTCSDKEESQPRWRDVTDGPAAAARQQRRGPVPQPAFQGVSVVEDCFGVPRFVTATRSVSVPN